MCQVNVACGVMFNLQHQTVVTCVIAKIPDMTGARKLHDIKFTRTSISHVFEVQGSILTENER